MPEVRCEAATCKHFKNDICTAPFIEIANLELDDTDVMECKTYEYNPNWYKVQMGNEISHRRLTNETR